MAKTEKWEEFLEAECSGSGPHAMLAGNPPVAETRSLPTGGDSNAILCYGCYRRELAWRRERNQSLAETAQFKLPAWDTLKIYSEAQS